jgi:FkbM family methyltransferase
MRHDLIYDVGMYKGADTEYYLSKGFSVVAVEANPQTAGHARKRFSEAIDRGQLSVLNVAIAETRGTSTFWVCDERPSFSTMDEAIVKKSRFAFRPVTVPTVPMIDILNEHGVPYYLKVDIEGSDHLCLRDLDPNDAPKYVSFEFLRLEDLFLLAARGYTQFKCIRQDTLRQLPLPAPTLASVRQAFERWLKLRLQSQPTALSALRASKSAARRLTGSQASAHRVDNGRKFQIGATGPFGEESDGSWQTIEEVVYAWLHDRFARNRTKPIWVDIHARRD